jgi:hypothetical protein
MVSSLALIRGEIVRESKNPPRVGRWVDVGLWNEPYGRHLYGVDHHHCRVANAVVLLIAVRVVLAIWADVNRCRNHMGI